MNTKNLKKSKKSGGCLFGRQKSHMRTRERFLNIGKKIAAMTFVTAVAAVFMAGCNPLDSLGVSSSYVFQIGKGKCSQKEAKMILLNYQKEYGNIYGIDMWAHDYGEEQSLEDYVKDLTLAQLAQVYTLDVIAGEQEVTLSEKEQELVSKAADEYFSGLAEDEVAYMGIEKDDAANLYERYVLAQKLYTTLTESVEQEVSDDEARIMRLKQIYTTDEAKANSVYGELQNEGDFDTLAASNNEADTTDINANRTTFPEDVTEKIFALQDGGISDVIAADGGYYIFYCVSSFDAELTEAHKADVLEQRMTDAVNSAYETYTGELDSSVNDDIWEGVKVDTSLKLEGSSFLEIYDKYFGEQDA